MDSDFICYEEENILLDTEYNNHIETSFDQSKVLNIVSSLEMDHVRDYIRDEIIQCKKKKTNIILLNLIDFIYVPYLYFLI